VNRIWPRRRRKPDPDRFRVGGQGRQFWRDLAPDRLEFRGKRDYLGNAELLPGRFILGRGDTLIEEEEERGDVALRLKQLMMLRLMPINVGGG
jgi:hypothetical protein